MLKAVIFDYDGVIADSFSVACRIINGIMRKNDRQTHSESEYREIFTHNAKSFFVKMGFADQKLISAMLHFEKVMSSEVKVFDGIDDVLKGARKKYKIALASNAPRKYVENTIKERIRLFDFTICGDEAKPKPNPEQILLCMEKLKVNAGETCLVGDMEQDIIAAKAAGLEKVIAVSYGFHGRERLSGADVIARSPQEILSLLNNGL